MQAEGTLQTKGVCRFTDKLGREIEELCAGV